MNDTETLVIEDIRKRQDLGLATTFGRWTLKSFHSAIGRSGQHKKWTAVCQCGKEKVVYLENLKRGKSLSCGCLRSEILSVDRRSHGHAAKQTPTYKSWSHLKGRCTNPLDRAYADYGGRGIKVCQRWANSFENFLLDMGEQPAGYSIERIDVNGNYEPSNCKWIPRNMQPRNTRATRFTEKEVAEIRKKLRDGVKPSEIARSLGCGAGHIRMINRNEIWKGV